MSSRVCKHCGGSDVDVDQARGDAVCMTCGSVLEDNIIVSEVQFEQNSAGSSNVIGQFVSSEGGKSMSFGGGFHHGIGKESRLITLQNGNRRIKQVGAQLKLNQHCIETAYNFYKMAVAKRLTRGRKSNHVVAACLYIVCRTEGTPHMLLDFADILQANVYTLGRTYLALAKELHINIPALDPCLYIQRFAHKLEFADKTHEVAMTALRLVSRMKRDWLAQGRRPSGLCGAALLVAARIHNFSRTIKEIIRVVKIGEQTIKKRLYEFEATPSGQLTIDEFNKIDLEEEADPPCFTEGKKRAKLLQLEEQLPELTEEVLQLQSEIDKEIEEHLIKKHKRYSKQVATTSSSQDDSACSAPSLQVVCKAEAEDINHEVNTFLESELVKDILHHNEIQDIRTSLKLPPSSGNETVDGGSTTLDSSVNSDGGGGLFDKDPDVEQLEQDELKSLVTVANITATQDNQPVRSRPTLASLGIKDTVEECIKNESSKTEPNLDESMEEEDGELDLTGLDDDELDGYILSDEAAKKKTVFWLKANAIYLKEQKEKEQKRLQEEEEEKNKPDHLKKKKRQVNRKKKLKTEHSTAGEAIEKMLQEKKISSKINYDVLKGLNTKTTTENKSTLPPSGSIFGEGPVEAMPVQLGSHKTAVKRSLTPLIKTEGSTKKLKVEAQSEVEADIIVESGPVEYTHHDDDAEAEDEYYEDEDEPISAATLMGHSGMDDYGHGEEEDYY